MMMSGIIGDSLKKFAFRKSAGGRLPVLLVTIGVVLPMVPVPAAGQVIIDNPPTGGGDIEWPEPYEGGGEFSDGTPIPPGCSITFRRGPGLLGPPCALQCRGGAADAASYDYQALCNSMQENSYGCWDENGHHGPCDEYDHENGCLFHKGVAGPTVGKIFLPHGHPRCFGVSGEPHLSSYDGLRFDLQAAGEFVATRSLDDNFEVQMRLEPYAGTSDRLSVVTGIAARVGPHRVTIRVKEDPPLRVDGKILELEGFAPYELAEAGALLIREGRRYSIVLADGTNVHADLFSGVMNFYVPLAAQRDGRMVGITGNGDGDEGTNDFRTRDGRTLASPLGFEALYKDFAESWRVTSETTLFDYAPGKSTETFTKRDMPVERITFDDLDPADRARAERVCREAGLRSGPALDECIFDYALTGDEVFIESPLSQQPSAEFALDPETLSIEAPSAEFAGHRVTLKIHGPVERGYWLGFAPKGSLNKGQAANPYSATVLKGDEEEVNLAVPMLPGEYELRYRENRGEATIALRQPFESVPPEIEIAAPDTAAAGGNVDVTLTGDIGEHMVATVVPAGSGNNERGRVIALKQGSEQTGTIKRLPEEPGDYEIRCISGYGRDKVVYASRELKIQ